MIPKVYPSIEIGMKRSSGASIANFLCGSVGSSHICIPNFWHWFGFINDFLFCFQAINLSQTPLLTPTLNQVSTQYHQYILVYSFFLYIMVGMETY